MGYDLPIVIDNCDIYDNSAETFGGGILCFKSWNVVIRNCKINGNTAGSEGGGLSFGYSATQATVEHCVITGNFAGDKGGGVSCIEYPDLYVTEIRIEGCTLSGNHAVNSGGAIANRARDLFVSNSILWDDLAGQGKEIAQFYGGALKPWPSATVTYSNVEGGASAVYGTGDLTWSPGNINTDPYFGGPGYWDSNDLWVYGDYHLMSEAGRRNPAGGWVYDAVNSPCIDAADPALDWADETTPNGHWLNMGAYGSTVQASRSQCLTPLTAIHPPTHITSPGSNYYQEWVDVGRPDCWCYPRQCHGDIDGRTQGDQWAGYWYVGTDDLNVLQAVWGPKPNMKEPPHGLGHRDPGYVGPPTALDPAGVPGICADTAHNIQGDVWTGTWRVGTDDINDLQKYWGGKQVPPGSGITPYKEPPHGTGVPPDCGGTVMP